MTPSPHYHLPPTTNTTIESLPNHILSVVLALIGASSIDDLFMLKFCSKNFLNLIEEDNYIYRQVSLQKLPYVPWFTTPQESLFLARCRECINPESLYREGMIKFFTPLMMNLDHNSPRFDLQILKDSSSYGLEILKEISMNGHKEAMYICGMILLCSEVEEDKKQGFEFLGILAKLGCMKTCRKKVEAFLKMLLWKNDLIRMMFMNIDNHRLCGLDKCLGLQEIARLERGWPIADEEDEASLISCQLCRCDYELRQFSKMVL